MIPWLENAERFPPLELALREPNGLLCAGGDLTPQRLVTAYLKGIFPWYSPGEPILWWSPDPRMVLFPAEFRLSRSLRKTLRNKDYRVRLDTRFKAVIEACARTKRKDQAGTWIAPEIQAAYIKLHELGYAHSVETWVDDRLVGGLYGIAIGKMFYGESMFAHATDASKIALAHLVRFLADNGFGLIDCQMNTAHLASLGAREIPRTEFTDHLRRLTATPPLCGRWAADAATRDWN
ncbi:leucyl/phenylalanyl-tRNA--protein transferase [Propionivibrio sp.]|jgi:leucyl/phenylalanyl-tRNA--protein transferase|uniref:leucyl/phenylalanyl-tRNA--protein transferase n=1 Tax=Propionivibrio sp. TaxID=2212460 RepID=UPI00272DD698|nr:leucyl/phenylalanyl-tRNA--protein transferase [Propionivibrio sp.]